MARLEIRPVTCQTTNSGWSQTLSLSTPPHIVDPDMAPAWIVALTLIGTTASDKGPELLESISQAFESIELKTPQALYQTLDRLLKQELHASVAAISLTADHITVMGRGNYSINLHRHGRGGLVITGNQDSDTWKVVEGTYESDDRWWLATGASCDVRENNPLNNENLERAIEEFHTQLISQSEPNCAHVFLFPSLETEPVVEKTDELAVPSYGDEPDNIVVSLPPSPVLLKKRRVMIIGWVLLLALGISVWLGSRARQEQRRSAAYTQLDQQITTALTAAASLVTSDQVQARQQLRNLQDQVLQSKSLFDGNKQWTDKWQQLNLKVTQSYQQLAGETELNDIPVWFSLSVIKPGFMGNRIVGTGDTLLVLDTATGTLAKITIPAKRGESLATGLSLKSPTALAADTSKAITLTDTGVVSSSLGKKSTATLIPSDPEWQQPSFIGLFNNNVYILDEGTSLIWRYSATTEGLATKKNWLGNGVAITSSVKSMAIDGDVWLLSQQGTVTRFRRGAPLSFSLSGLDQPISNSITGLAVASDDKVALIDAGNQRVVITTKQGSYLKQVKWPGFATAEDITFSSDGKSLFILKNGAIYTTLL